ncbi:MAG TPA: PadR family transcriptional regulator [Ktedonobacteraceae bacterium]|nr:PadR family transcriptional regulator [Ktedonobacteraceae bacterium]
MEISEPAEYAILGLLESQPMHGYEMFQQFKNGAMGQIVHLEMSQMYAFLKKLERLEYIEAQLETQGPRPPRKIFHLTTEGRQAFFQWLKEPVERPREIRILFLIKLYFVQQLIPKEIGPLIDQQIISCRNFLNHLESQHPIPLETSDGAFFDHVVLRGRIYQTRSLLDWLRELQHQLAETQRQ